MISEGESRGRGRGPARHRKARARRAQRPRAVCTAVRCAPIAELSKDHDRRASGRRRPTIRTGLRILATGTIVLLLASCSGGPTEAADHLTMLWPEYTPKWADILRDDSWFC